MVISDTAKHCPKCGAATNAANQARPPGSPQSGGQGSTLATTLNAPAASVNRADDSLIGRVLANRYRLVEKLGQGGMGVVYKGEHIRIHRPTAIKVLNADLSNNPEFIARFEREAEMASRIKHPNAVDIYDFGEAEDGIVYLAMEYLAGVPLSSIIKNEGPLALERTIHILDQAADALHAAHELGIVHRDLKPDNIMICKKSGRVDWVEVVDFGLAKGVTVEAALETLTQVGFVLGTPDYMSPEQVGGDDLDSRSDLYSLAVVAYEMLTCAFPFEGSTQQKRMVKRLLEPPKPVRQLNPSLPVAVERILMKALSREVDDRHASTVEFVTELKEALAINRAQTQPQQPAVRPEPSRPPQPAASRPQQDAPPIFCSRCGSRIESGVRFCNDCGAPVSGGFPTVPVPPVQANTPVNPAMATSPRMLQPPAYPPVNPAPAPFVAPPPRIAPLPQRGSRGGKRAAIVITSLIVLIAIGVAVYLIVGGKSGDNGLTNAEKLATSLRYAISSGRLVTLADDDARTYYFQLKEVQPNHPALNEAASTVLPQLQRLGDDIFKKKKAVSSDALTTDDWIKTLRAYEWAKAIDPSDRSLEARWRFAEGEVAKQQGRKDDAERSYTAATQLDQNWSLPHNSLGLLRIDSRRYMDAVPYYQRAIDLDPTWEIPYNNMGSAYFLAKDYDTAESYYNKAIEKNPNWARPHYWLGSIYQNKNWTSEAIEQYEIALKLDPNGDINNEIRKRIERLQSTTTQ
jgi:serine/threonine-protein kinase